MKRSLFFIPAVLFLLLPPAAFVPTGAYGQDAPQTPTLTEHLQTELRSKAAMRRHLALLDVAGLAHCLNDCQLTLNTMQNQPLHTTERLDLTSLTPELLAAYRRGPEDGQRLLALWALIGIGDEEALATLVDEGARQSTDVNRVTQRGLAAFYLEKYPELANKAKWTGEISLADIERAKKVRVKRAEKVTARGQN